jgi:hypothetical protein
MPAPAADRLDGLKGAAARENREPAEQPLFRLGLQVE